MPRNIHLVGSVPLADARIVFETVSAALGSRLKRIPDGETGERSDWIAHLEPIFAGNPALEKSDEVFRLHPTAPGRTRYRLRPGKAAQDCVSTTCSMPITPSRHTATSRRSSGKARSRRLAASRSISFLRIR